MIAYAFVNTETNIVENVMNWGDNIMPEGYNIPTTQYVLELNEDKNTLFFQTMMANKKIKIINKDTLEFEEVIPVVVKQPTEIELLQQRLTQAEADNLTALEALAEVYEQLIALQAQVNPV